MEMSFKLVQENKADPRIKKNNKFIVTVPRGKNSSFIL